jgi:hypothetical protein
MAKHLRRSFFLKAGRPMETKTNWVRDAIYVDLMASFLWHFRTMKHFFLAEGVADFCEASVRELSSEFAKALPNCPRVKAPAPAENWANTPQTPCDTILGSFAIHFPTKERNRSIVVIPGCEIPVSETVALKYYFAATDGVDTVLGQPDIPDLEPTDDQTLDRIPKLVYGFSLYLDAFPETVVAASDNIHSIKKDRRHGAFVSRHSIVDEEEKSATSPHWRRGHFRLLSSGMFVKKKGQTIFVRGTFVRGHGMDVLDY